MSKKKREIEYETVGVDFEKPSKETTDAAPKDTFTHKGGCYCGKRVGGCDGNPVKVQMLRGGVPNYVCPHGRPQTSVPPKVYQAAKKSGLVE